jgi:hypothetical protein
MNKGGLDLTSGAPELTTEDWAHIRAGGRVSRKNIGGQWHKWREPITEKDRTRTELLAIYNRWIGDNEC